MKPYVILLFIVITSIYATGTVQAQQQAIIDADSAAVHKERSRESKIIKYLYCGEEISFVQSISGWIVLPAGGYIEARNLTSKNRFSSSDCRMAVSNLQSTSEVVRKDPNQYTQEELLYMLVEEQRKNADLRNSIRTIKNIEVASFVLGIVGIIVSAYAISQ